MNAVGRRRFFVDTPMCEATILLPVLHVPSRTGITFTEELPCSGYSNVLPPHQNDRKANHARLCLEPLEDRAVPATLIYSNTFGWNGVATVAVTVTQDAPGYAGQYLWNYHLTNQSYTSGITTFALPAEDSSMVSGLGSSVNWLGSVGSFMSNPDLVAWLGPQQPGGGGEGGEGGPPGSPSGLAVGQSADFWFTTAPRSLGLTNGVISNGTLTSLSVMPAGLVVTPLIAAPVPQQALPLVVKTEVDKDNRFVGPLSLRDAMNYVILHDVPVKNEIEFTKPGMTDKTITLNLQLPTINTSMYINGSDRNITITRDATKGEFRLFEVNTNQIVSIYGLALTGGGGPTIDDGGAIKSYGKLHLTNCTIHGNSAFEGGGVNAVGGTLDIVNCDIHHNAGGRSAGIHIGPYVTTANITSSRIHHNTADSEGGGIYVDGGQNLVVNLINDLIYLNLALSNGGGVTVSADSSASLQLTLVGNTQIYANWAWGTDSKGGGVYLGAGTLATAGNVLIGYPLITNNYAAFGGGIYKVAGANLNLTGMTVSGNLDDDLGGAP